MRRYITYFLIIGICFLLQTTVFQALAFANITPNLMVIVVSAIGFMRGRKEGLWVGFLSGLLIDIFFGFYLGVYALIYMYIGYLNGKFNRIFYPEDIKLPLALILCSDLAYGLLCYLLFFLMRGKFHFGYYLLHIILPEAVYTIVVTLLLYPLILWINKRLESREQRSARKFV